MKTRLALSVVAALALLAGATLAAILWNARGSSAARSTSGSKLAFAAAGSHLNTSSDVYVIDSDGSNRRLLSRCPIGSGDAVWLKFPFGCVVRAFSWSPDGRRLAFVRGRQGGSTLSTDLSLFVIGLDGASERRLAGCGGPRWPSCSDFFGSRPLWSPDGSRLVVPRRGRLLAFDVDRGVYRRLTRGCRPRVCFDMQPAWSPDGARIVFVRTEGRISRSIYSVKVDGSDVKKLTNLPTPGWAANPAWSPDGRRIVFDAGEYGRASRMYSMAPDGSDLTVLKSGTGFSGSSWSPDGRQLVYLSTVPVGPARPGALAGPGFVAELWVIQPDGTGARRLYRSRDGIGHYAKPQWSPDGKQIVFGVILAGDLGGDVDREGSGTFLINADGSGLRKLSAVPLAAEVAWQPHP